MSIDESRQSGGQYHENGDSTTIDKRKSEVGWYDFRLLSDDELNEYDGLHYSEMKSLANENGICLVDVFRSAVERGRSLGKRKLESIIHSSPDFIELKSDYENGALTVDELIDKYGRCYSSTVKILGYSRSCEARIKTAERRRKAAGIASKANACRYVRSGLDEAISSAVRSDDPIDSLLSIDYASLSSDVDGAVDHIRLFGPYEKRSLIIKEGVDNDWYLDPYVKNGKILKREILEKMLGTPVWKIAKSTGVSCEEVYRSAFYWGIRTHKSMDGLRGDYGEFVQDWVDGRLSNEHLELKYGPAARKRAYKMGLKRSRLGVKRSKLRQGGKLNESYSTLCSRARMVVNAIIEVGMKADDIDGRLIRLLNDGKITEKDFVRLDDGDVSKYDLRKAEHDCGMSLTEHDGNVLIDVDYAQLDWLATVDFLVDREISEKTGLSVNVVRQAKTFYGIVPDYDSIAYEDARGISYRRLIPGYESMTTAEKRRASYEYKTGYSSPLENPTVTEKMLDSIEQTTGMRKRGMANPVIRKTILETRASRGMEKTNFEDPAWQSRYSQFNGLSKGGISKQAKEVARLLDRLGISYETNDRKLLDGLELDFYIPSANMAIEVSPSYTHSSDRYPADYRVRQKPDSYHREKAIAASNSGCSLATLFDWAYDDSRLRGYVVDYIEWMVSGRKVVDDGEASVVSAVDFGLNDDNKNLHPFYAVDGRPEVIEHIPTHYVVGMGGSVIAAFHTDLHVDGRMIVDKIYLSDWYRIRQVLDAIEDYAYDEGEYQLSFIWSMDMPIDDVFVSMGYSSTMLPLEPCYVPRSSNRPVSWTVACDLSLEEMMKHGLAIDDDSVEEFIENNLAISHVCGSYRMVDCGFKKWSKTL